jgi:23S rRNA (guanosine2251-2'-O)-methyltransferase
MAGNSQRPNRRKTGTKKGAVVGSGGQRRKALKGKGPTPAAEERTKHPAAKKAASAARRAASPSRVGQPRTAPGRRGPAAKDAPELLVGRNPVAEALRAQIPATALYVAYGLAPDERVTEAIATAADRGLSIMEVSRQELDRMTGGVLHQGIGLQVPPYQYLELEDVLATAGEALSTPLLVALDGVTDPRNLGAVVRSAAAFGAQGVILPERRAAGMTATAWRTSAGAAARLPVARVTNLVRSLKTCQDQGYVVAGLDADGEISLDELEAAVDPLVIVVGSEGRGLSRLVGEVCDLRVSIPMGSLTESLNASVAAAVTLAEVARRRRISARSAG